MADETPSQPAEGEYKIVEEKELDRIKVVCRNAMLVDGLKRGAKEAIKALDRGVGEICFLAQGLKTKQYEDLVRAFCKERKVPLIEVESGKKLGEAVGLYKLDQDGQPTKVLSCGSAVVTKFGHASAQLEKLAEDHGIKLAKKSK